jgi:preprotein translocase subunit SecG
MLQVLLVIHLLIAAALVGIVLMQKSDGGALGIGSGGGFMTGRGAANFLTRTTAWLGGAFFATSIALTVLASNQTRPTSVFDTPGAKAPVTAPATPTAPPAGTPPAPSDAGGRGGILDRLQQNPGGSAPAVPKNQ